MEIVFTLLSLYITQSGGESRLCVPLRLTLLLYEALQFRTTPRSRILLNGARDCFLKLVGPVGKMFHGFCLIDVCHLFAKIPGAGMDHKVDVAFIVLIKFDEMVAAAE